MSRIVKPGERLGDFCVGQRVRVVGTDGNDQYKGYEGTIGSVTALDKGLGVLICPDRSCNKKTYWLRDNPMDDLHHSEYGAGMRILNQWIPQKYIRPIEVKINDDGNLV